MLTFKNYGMSPANISEALTHSEVATTKTYINANNVIELTPADFAFKHLAKSNSGELVGNLVGISEKKDTHQMADVQNR